MRTTFRAALMAAATALATPAQAWDYPGHRIVGAIADLVLQERYPEIYKKVQAKLAIKDASGHEVTRTLSEVAVFPDCAKPGNREFCGRDPSEEEQQYAARNKQHPRFHYTDVPLEQRKYVADTAGTGKIDVVHMINYATAQLRGQKPKIDGVDLTDAEAIWLLAHLVGDIHQPLHVGARYYDKTCLRSVDPNEIGQAPTFGIGQTSVETIGGNNITLTVAAPAVPFAANLHFYWDGAAVAQAMQGAGTGSAPAAEKDFARILAAKAPEGWDTKGDAETWATKWASEIMPTAVEAHRKLMIRRSEGPAVDSHDTLKCKWKTTLDAAYQDWAKEHARVQLAKAGFRLAALMNAIFAAQN
jgi:hypothetical protein